jgi:hypothetical protein
MRYIIISFLFLSLGSQAQQNSFVIPRISPEKARQDLKILRDTLEEIHPGLYRYQSKAQLNRIFDSCYIAVKDTIPLTSFFVLTSRMIAAIEDGHANCRLQREWTDAYAANIKVFPAQVLFLNSHAYIACCKQNNELTEAELLSIDHHPVKEIVGKLFSLIPSDGKISSRKNWELDGTFPMLYNFVYGAKANYEITYRSKDDGVKSAILKADLSKDVSCFKLYSRPEKYLRLDYRPGGVAVMTVLTFFNGFLDQTKENFSQFMASSFKELKEKHIQKLIIDIRANQGGNDGNGLMLYSYISSQPFRYYASLESVNKKFTEPDSDHVNLGIHQPALNHFDGKVYILTDGRSFSVATEFPAMARSHNRAIFIGEETGGGYYGNTSGDEAFVTLPNSGISCRIPEDNYFGAVKKTKYKDRGVIPDHIVIPAISDVLNHRDPQLDAALKLADRD